MFCSVCLGPDKGHRLLISSNVCQRAFLSRPAHAALWTASHDCGPVCSILEAGHAFLGRCCNCYRGWAERPVNKWPFAAGWIGSLFRWQSSLIVGESFFSYEYLTFLKNHQKRYWYLTEWNGDLFDRQLVLFFSASCAPFTGMLFISWNPFLRSVDLF